jgi:hypothetical protein
MKNLKPILTLLFLIIILFFAIREKQTTIEIINNLLYQEETLQNKTKHD